MDQYLEFCRWVDSCENEEEMRNYRKNITATALRNEFWKLRRISLNAETTLEKERALAKIHWINQYFGCRIPCLRSINQFTAPEGLYGIFIAPKAIIGTGCVIFQNVTICGNTLPDAPNAGFPVIGDNVHIGANAVISGNVLIGNNVRIAPNCCVTEDVLSNSIVTPAGVFAAKAEYPLDNQHIGADQFQKKRFDRTVYDYAENPGDPEISVRKATAEDIDTVMGLYKERFAWFKWKKVSQWSRYLQNHPREEFLEKIAIGEYHLVMKGSECIGGFALSENSENWQDQQTDAYYLCRAVSKVGYKNLGTIMVEEARRQTEAAGKVALRLECIYSNQQLNDLWEKLGFAFVRDAETDYHWSLRQWQEKAPEPAENPEHTQA